MCVGGNIGQAYFKNIIFANTHYISANTHETSAHEISANTNVTINRFFESHLWKSIRANIVIIIKIILANLKIFWDFRARTNFYSFKTLNLSGNVFITPPFFVNFY